jgi:hypothetical protein
MKELSRITLLISTISALVALFASLQTFAQTCPGNDMPDSIKVFYIKYKIIDELWARLYKEMGAPSNVRGDELEELILWKDYRWERRYGKSWQTDSDKERKYQDDAQKKWDDIELRQSRGDEVPMEEIDKLAIEQMNHRPEQKIYEYDWIDVKAPEYSLYYNRSNKKGHGSLGRRITRSDIDRMDGESRKEFDNWANSSFKDTDKILGLEKISTKKSKMLGYDVVCDTTKTSFGDVLRKYDQIEVCKATIAGIDIDLYEKMGKAGEHYIKQAVEINTAYPVKKERFCAPDYVEMSTP